MGSTIPQPMCLNGVGDIFLQPFMAFYPPTQKATVSQTVDECGEGTPRSSERA